VTSQLNLFDSGDGTLILVRHGETVGQSSIRYYGRTDIALSEHGRAQMLAVARVLSRVSFKKVFSSPLSRARESARLIIEHNAQRADSPLVAALEEFVEVDFGRFEGLTAEEIKLRWPNDYEVWSRLRLHDGYSYPGGESRGAFNARVSSGIERMFGLWRGEAASELRGAALLVAHRGVIRAIVKSLVGLEPAIELGSIQALRFDGSAWQPLALDLTCHLASAG
jgi:broad specificity phosphatase PhoE